MTIRDTDIVWYRNNTLIKVEEERSTLKINDVIVNPIT